MLAFTRTLRTLFCWTAFYLVAASAQADPATALGVKSEYLDPSFWIERLENPDQVQLDTAAIAALNSAMRDRDPSFFRLAQLPQTLSADEVRARVVKLSAALPENSFTENGKTLKASPRRKLQRSLALNKITDPVTPQFGLIVRRAPLRTYPTGLRVFNRVDDLDIDRFQESALFLGDAIAVLHRSADRRWCFIVSERYAAWVEVDAIALGERASVLGYAAHEPSLTVVGNHASTVFTREAPALSQLKFDMGVRLALDTDGSSASPINGQLPLAAWVVDLPQRDAKGHLIFKPALIARSEPVALAPLPHTQANVIRQAFRFLGERYGWGHDFHGRDCSGFVSEVYRSLGVLLPRNTRDQATSPVLDRIALEGVTDPVTRASALASLQVGDLIYITGHVMLVIGRINGEIWLIHDVHGVNVIDVDGQLQHLELNGVSVTPLGPLMADAVTPLRERITNIQRVRLGHYGGSE